MSAAQSAGTSLTAGVEVGHGVPSSEVKPIKASISGPLKVIFSRVKIFFHGIDALPSEFPSTSKEMSIGVIPQFLPLNALNGSHPCSIFILGEILFKHSEYKEWKKPVGIISKDGTKFLVIERIGDGKEIPFIFMMKKYFNSADLPAQTLFLVDSGE